MVQECFQVAKNETGLSHYQARKWDPWYLPITMVTHTFLVVAAAMTPKAHVGQVASQSPRPAAS